MTNTSLNADDGMKMPLGKRKLRELIEDAWYDAPSASAGFGRIEVIIEQQIEADRKRVELEARINELNDVPFEAGSPAEEHYKLRIAELKAQQES